MTGYRVGYVANADNSGGPWRSICRNSIGKQHLVWGMKKNGLFRASASALNAGDNGGNVMWALAGI